MNPDFANNLTNPMKAAVLGVKRRARFIEGYNPITDLREVLVQFFGDRSELENTGLTLKYRELVNWVRENKAIGLIIIGADPTNYQHGYDDLIVKYTTQTYIKIDITMKSICQNLLREYIGNDNIELMCESTYNYDGYLRSVRENSSRSL